MGRKLTQIENYLPTPPPTAALKLNSLSDDNILSIYNVRMGVMLSRGRTVKLLLVTRLTSIKSQKGKGTIVSYILFPDILANHQMGTEGMATNLQKSNS